MSDFSHEPMLELFIFETSQLLEQLEEILISSEKFQSYSINGINEIFRIMHTIKGSSAMMLFDNISSLAHSIEDIFYFIREKNPEAIDYSQLTDLILKGADFIARELIVIGKGEKSEKDSSQLILEIDEFLTSLKESNLPKEERETFTSPSSSEKQKYFISSDSSGNLDGPLKRMYEATIFFEDDCQHESIRAFAALHNLQGLVDVIHCFPQGVLEEDESEECAESIRQEGFKVMFKTNHPSEMIREILMDTLYLKHLELNELSDQDFVYQVPEKQELSFEKMAGQLDDNREQAIEMQSRSVNQSIISVSVTRLDQLMDLVGEMVIAEAMVIQNPDLQGLELANFQKAASQLNKITSEIQDIVMSIRMVPLSATFHRMNRIVRDMCKKLDKDVQLEIIGEETEVDKNIIEHIADPLVHLVRNALDHGIETTSERKKQGKPSCGTITLEAKNAGSDVLIIVKDDGKGLSREQFIAKAEEKDLLTKPAEQMTDKEVFQLIMVPGFSVKDQVSEFSGRGVGMDLVASKIEAIGGSVAIDSSQGKGTIITMKIPLTLAIIDGINAKVGNSCYTLPTISIKEFFRPEERDLLVDTDGNEMIMVRGNAYPVMRLHEHYNVQTKITEFTEGVMIMVEQDEKSLCIFADELLGQQQVVVKAMPEYIRRRRKIKGLAGCTLLGDGSISLIIDIAGLISEIIV